MKEKKTKQKKRVSHEKKRNREKTLFLVFREAPKKVQLFFLHDFSFFPSVMRSKSQ